MEKKEQFKEFVKNHPLLKFEVRDNKRSWQNIFEEWDLLGEGDKSWNKYVENEKKDTLETVPGQETIRNVMGYIKKINPDSITKVLGNVNKIASLLSGLTGNKTTSSKLTGDPLFDKKFDDWY